MRVVFMGSPDFALPSLHTLARHYELVGVVTQPDRRAGRGRKPTASPVKQAAVQYSVQLLQPSQIKEPAFLSKLKKLRPDVIVVAAYGQILPAELLEFPPHGCINVHASLLPRWRGAAPIPAAILHGDQFSGITIMKMDIGLDTGPIISQNRTELFPDETSATLSERLSTMGAQLLHETLMPYCSGHLIPTPQDDTLATYAPMIKKSDGWMDWRKPSIELDRQVRAYNPWPGSFFEWNSRRIIVLRSRSLLGASTEPGIVTMYDNLPAVGTSAGILVLDKLQPSGRKPMPGDVFLRGAHGFQGSNLLIPD
jgi:methionyl-tRNA formyltransferase